MRYELSGDFQFDIKGETETGIFCMLIIGGFGLQISIHPVLPELDYVVNIWKLFAGYGT